jgi:hypothetical protein
MRAFWPGRLSNRPLILVLPGLVSPKGNKAIYSHGRLMVMESYCIEDVYGAIAQCHERHHHHHQGTGGVNPGCKYSLLYSIQNSLSGLSFPFIDKYD